VRPHLPQQNTDAPAHANLCNSASPLLSRKQFRTIFSIMQELCRLLFATRPPAVSTIRVAWWLSAQETMQIHASSWPSRGCDVLQASSDYASDPLWCGSHPAGLWLGPEAWAQRFIHEPWKNSICVIFSILSNSPEEVMFIHDNHGDVGFDASLLEDLYKKAHRMSNFRWPNGSCILLEGPKGFSVIQLSP